jgi:DNA polymerase (family 10)
MTNADLANTFDEIAELLEFQGANTFRVRAYRNAARTIRDLSEPLAAVIDDPSRSLTDIKNIGADLAEKIRSLVTTGELKMLNDLRSEVPQGVLQLLRIPGLGAKKAATLHKELGIQSLEELKAACEAGQVEKLKGFGAKTQQQILAGMSLAETANARILWADADQVAGALREHLLACPAVQQLELAGSYRRGRDTIGDLDALVVSQDVAGVMSHFQQFAHHHETIARGETKMSIRTRAGLQIDLRVVPAESFGAALQYFTGSKDHNVILRGRAKALGMKINEYGVYRLEDGRETYIAGRTEEDVYATLGLPLIPPELREARHEFEWADARQLPALVELADIRGDLHMHTTATDGAATIEQMVAAAQARGLSYICITDHSKRVSMARGLQPEQLLAQWAQIDEIRKTLPKNFTLLKGIECDILEKGGMDLPDDVLAQGDFIIASVHYGQKQSRAEITARILDAIENPHVSMIAHPTGRLLNRREAYDVDLDAVFAAAKQHRKLLELNANPWRLDLNDIFCATAKEHGIPIVINTDAHATDELAQMRYGILQARRAGLAASDVANTRPWLELKKLIGVHRYR